MRIYRTKLHPFKTTPPYTELIGALVQRKIKKGQREIEARPSDKKLSDTRHQMHPEDEGGYQAAQTSDCVRCHEDYHTYPYGYYYSPYPSYWWEYDRYGQYYAYPWWWSYYDYPYLNDDYVHTGSASQRATKFDRREVSRTPQPPPHSTRSAPGFGDPVRPGMYGLPVDNSPGTSDSPGTSGDVTRPSTDGNADSRSKDSNSGKTGGKSTRQSDNRTQTVQPDNTGSNTGSDNQATKKQGEKKARKKARRGGKDQ